MRSTEPVPRGPSARRRAFRYYRFDAGLQSSQRRRHNENNRATPGSRRRAPRGGRRRSRRRRHTVRSAAWCCAGGSFRVSPSTCGSTARLDDGFGGPRPTGRFKHGSPLRRWFSESVQKNGRATKPLRVDRKRASPAKASSLADEGTSRPVHPATPPAIISGFSQPAGNSGGLALLRFAAKEVRLRDPFSPTDGEASSFRVLQGGWPLLLKRSAASAHELRRRRPPPPLRFSPPTWAFTSRPKRGENPFEARQTNDSLEPLRSGPDSGAGGIFGGREFQRKTSISSVPGPRPSDGRQPEFPSVEPVGGWGWRHQRSAVSTSWSAALPARCPIGGARSPFPAGGAAVPSPAADPC